MNPYDHQVTNVERHGDPLIFEFPYGTQGDVTLLMIEQVVDETSNVVWTLSETASNMVYLQVIANYFGTTADVPGLDDNICDVGLSEETISKHLEVSIKQGRTSGNCEDEEEEDKCAICLGEYEEKDTMGTLDCGHGYHEECIKGWLLRKNVCPMCRATALTI